MKKEHYLLTVLLFATILSFGQKTKKVKENAVYGKAKFYVLKSDETIKHGEYKITSYTPPFRNLVKGKFVNGEKDGLWVEKYDEGGGQIKVQGNYDHGKKIGEWKYFNSEGKIIQVYDFERDLLITNAECGYNELFEVKVNGKTEQKRLTCPPTRIGGIAIFKKELFREIVNKSPFKINPKGRTDININETLSFFISEEGEIKGIYYSGAEENQELASLINNYLLNNSEGWISGKIDEEKLEAKLTIPVRIRMMF